MPDNIVLYDGTKEIHTTVATENELLEFVNTIRSIGGADFLEALIPSKPKHHKKCLLAQALNFECEVGGLYPAMKYEDGSWVWTMKIHQENIFDSNQLSKKIANELGLPVFIQSDNFRVSIVLPKEIGNVASAFDQGIKFVEYQDRLI